MESTTCGFFYFEKNILVIFGFLHSNAINRFVVTDKYTIKISGYNSFVQKSTLLRTNYLCPKRAVFSLV